MDTFCLGCSSTTHIVLAMIHDVHVATIRVWQGKAQPICTFLPEKHGTALSLRAVTSTQMGVNIMQPATSDLQIITWQLKQIKGEFQTFSFFNCIVRAGPQPNTNTPDP